MMPSYTFPILAGYPYLPVAPATADEIAQAVVAWAIRGCVWFGTSGVADWMVSRPDDRHFALGYARALLDSRANSAAKAVFLTVGAR